MFYYYGRKKRLAPLYPQPEYDIIIEPFAGSAAYSLHGDNWKKRVILVDKNPKTIAVWKYLQRTFSDRILELPNPEQGTKLTDLKDICEEEIWLIGYHTSVGAEQNTNSVSKFSRWKAGQKYIADNLYKIRHFEIWQGDYQDIADIELTATWFIDPPYMKYGKHYSKFQIDYSVLRDYCLSRKGQIIVCGSDADNYLEFKPLATRKVVKKRFATDYMFTR